MSDDQAAEDMLHPYGIDNPTNAQNDPEFPALEAYVKSVIGDNPTSSEWIEHARVSANIIKDLREQLAAEGEKMQTLRDALTNIRLEVTHVLEPIDYDKPVQLPMINEDPVITLK